MSQSRACEFCEGTGARDSGGVLPWGEAIFVKCGDCNGTGKVENYYRGPVRPPTNFNTHLNRKDRIKKSEGQHGE